MESHDHMEANTVHTHGLGAQYVLHQQHGMANARNALETLNYTAEKMALSRSGAGEALSRCSLLVVAGPKIALLPAEVATIQKFLAAGGNGVFLLAPFVTNGLEPGPTEYRHALEQYNGIDQASQL